MSPHILIVEDNADLAFGLQRNLQFEGYEVEVCDTGAAGLERATAESHDLLILDLMLPDVDGLTVLQRMRSAGVETPVLILTAKSGELDKVRGLRTGADDYLTKPFGVLELVARVEALLRRAPRGSPDPAEAVFAFGDVEVDVSARSVRRSGSPVALTPREFELLVALAGANGSALSRQQLLRDVWGHKADVSTRTVDTHVGELRRKLEVDPANPTFIVTVRKFGYRLDSLS